MRHYLFPKLINIKGFKWSDVQSCEVCVDDKDFTRFSSMELEASHSCESLEKWLSVTYKNQTKTFRKKSQFLYYVNNQKHLLKTYSFCLDDADDRCIFNASGNLYWLLHQKYSMIFQAQFIFSFCVNTVTRICIHRRSWFD